MLLFLNRFRTSENGTIVILFSIVFVVLILAAGMAVDFTQQSRAQAIAQEATDAAAIAGLRQIKLMRSDDDEAHEKARIIFNKNIADVRGLSIVSVTPSFIEEGPATEATYRVMVDGFIDTSLLKIIGIDTLRVSTFAETKVGEQPALEIALVMDQSRSMRGDRREAARTVGLNFINTLLEGRDDDRVKIATVPFNRYASIHPSLRDEPWIEVQPDETITWEECETRPIDPGDTCRKISEPCIIDGLPSMCDRTVCTGPSERICTTHTVEKTFKGCVGSRPEPYNTTDGDYDLEPIIGLVEHFPECGSWLRPLTSHLERAKNVLTYHYGPKNDTYIASGLIWGWRVLSAEPPFDEGMTTEEMLRTRGKKAIVLMSDGRTTASPTFPLHDGDDGDLGEDISLELCEKIKKEFIDIYAVAFEIDDPAALFFLQQCASSELHYYRADDADELAESFSSIAERLLRLSIAE